MVSSLSGLVETLDTFAPIKSSTACIYCFAFLVQSSQDAVMFSGPIRSLRTKRMDCDPVSTDRLNAWVLSTTPCSYNQASCSLHEIWLTVLEFVEFSELNADCIRYLSRFLFPIFKTCHHITDFQFPITLGRAAMNIVFSPSVT